MSLCDQPFGALRGPWLPLSDIGGEAPQDPCSDACLAHVGELIQLGSPKGEQKCTLCHPNVSPTHLALP